MPDFSQNFNRYSYALNNPLSYTDPSGEVAWLVPLISGALIGGAGYTANIALSDGGFDNWDWGDFVMSVGVGAISGLGSAQVGQAFGSIGSMGFGGEFARAFAHASTQGFISATAGGNYLSGFAAGGLSSLGGSAFMLYGGRFANSTVGNYAFSGLAGGFGAELAGGNFWEGSVTGLITAGLNHLEQGLKRPSFNDLLKGYPTDGKGGDMKGEDVYKLLGGDVLAEHNRNPNAYRNACALRTSRALNYAGIDIPKISGKTLAGADGKNYFFRASDLFKWMSKPAVFGKPNISTNNAALLKGNKGVYIMQAHYPARFGAWGHATLYNGSNFIGHGYVGPHAYRYNLWNF